MWAKQAQATKLERGDVFMILDAGGGLSSYLLPHPFFRAP